MIRTALDAALPLAAGRSGGGIGGLLLPVLLFGGFYFAVIRPQRRRAAQARSVVDTLTPGRRVVTTSGLIATVVAVEETEVELELAPGVRTRWVKGAVARPLDEPTPHEEIPPADPA